MTLRPILSTPTFDTNGLTHKEIFEKQRSLPETWRWPYLWGFEDGKTYEISVSHQANVQKWMKGSIEGLLAMRDMGLRLEIRREVISYAVVETARFEVRRPDRDGSSNFDHKTQIPSSAEERS